MATCFMHGAGKPGSLAERRRDSFRHRLFMPGPYKIDDDADPSSEPTRVRRRAM
jgi:hypothetical protein